MFTLVIVLSVLASGFAQKYTIKFATLAPDGSTWLKVMDEYNNEVQQLTNGAVKFKIYPGGIQGDEKDVLRKIRLGQLQSAGFTGVGLGEILPESRILDAPLLFTNYAEVDHVTGALIDEFIPRFEDAGFVLIGFTEVGFVYVFGNKPITSTADLKGVKMWMWEGDPIAEATFNALKVTPIPLSIADVLTSLQTNLIDAVYTSPLACVSLQWYTRVKYMMDYPLADAHGAVLIAKKAFDKISPQYQEILLDKGREYMKKLVQLSREDNQQSIDLMKKNGIEIVSIPAKNIAEFQKAGQEARENLVGKLYGKALLDSVQNEVARFKATEKESK
jgi:TRAP-type C4-dicarboxylate transport system substrate-binding protein